MKKISNIKTHWRNPLLMIAVLFIVFALVSCAEQTVEPVENPDGFLKGLLHGFILLFSFIGSIFADFKIYSFPNNGFWYDFGFFLGVSMFFGGSSAGSKSRRKSRQSRRE